MTESQIREFIKLVKEKLCITNSYFYKGIEDPHSLQVYRSNFSHWLAGRRGLTEFQVRYIYHRCLELMKIIDVSKL